MHEVENNQKELWRLYHDPRSSYELKMHCQVNLAKLSSMLLQMYDALPIVNEIVRRKSITGDNIDDSNSNSLDVTSNSNEIPR
jgi:hypothetical protein